MVVLSGALFDIHGCQVRKGLLDPGPTVQTLQYTRLFDFWLLTHFRECSHTQRLFRTKIPIKLFGQRNSNNL